MEQGNGSGQPQVPRDEGSPWGGCAFWDHLPVKPPGMKLLVQAFPEGMSGKSRSLSQSCPRRNFLPLLAVVRLQVYKNRGTLLRNELDIKGDPRNPNAQNQLCIHLSSSVILPTPMGESNSSAPIFHFKNTRASLPKLCCFSKVFHVDTGIP